MIPFDGFAGLRNDVPTDRYEIGDLQIANNVIIDDSNKIVRRDGYIEKVSGNVHSLWSKESLCFYCMEDRLYQLHDDYTSTLIRSDLTENAPMSYAWIADRVYFCNGHENGVIDGGIARSWGMDVPGPFNATDYPGTMDAGTYQFTMTFVRMDGQESGATTAEKIEVSGGGIRFTDLPVSDDDTVTHKIIYLSTANGESLMEALAIENDVTEATVTECLTVNPLETFGLCPPPVGHIVAEYFGHVILAVDDFLYVSKAYGPEHFDALDYFAFDSRITMIGVTSNGVFIGTEQSLCFISGTAVDEWNVTEVSKYGVREGSHVVTHSRLLGMEGTPEGYVSIWLSDQGICAGFSGGTVYNLTDPRYQHTGQSVRSAGLIYKRNGSTFYLVSI